MDVSDLLHRRKTKQYIILDNQLILATHRRRFLFCLIFSLTEKSYPDPAFMKKFLLVLFLSSQQGYSYLWMRPQYAEPGEKRQRWMETHRMDYYITQMLKTECLILSMHSSITFMVALGQSIPVSSRTPLCLALKQAGLTGGVFYSSLSHTLLC